MSTPNCSYVTYTSDIQRLIFNEARDYLVRSKGYPTALKSLEYDPDFAIRGLHYDARTGQSV